MKILAILQKITNMKTLVLKLLALFFVFILVFALSNCKKDTACKAVITVKMLSDTNIVVPFVLVKVNKQSVPGAEYYNVEGYTDRLGQFKYTFPLEAILDVNTKLDTNTDGLPTPDPQWIVGEGTLRLKPGETVNKSIFMQ